jgi:Fur family transcriptional regulator, ferric uptake regulator
VVWVTVQQDTIRQALAEAGTFISAQDLHIRLRSAGHRIGLATVYRTLHALADEGAVDVLRARDRQSIYRACIYRACGSTEPHHHLLCRSCGRTVEVPARLLDEWAAGAGEEHGFTDVTPIAEFFGTCADCSAPAPPGPVAGRRQAFP